MKRLKWKAEKEWKEVYTHTYAVLQSEIKNCEHFATKKIPHSVMVLIFAFRWIHHARMKHFHRLFTFPFVCMCDCSIFHGYFFVCVNETKNKYQYCCFPNIYLFIFNISPWQLSSNGSGQRKTKDLWFKIEFLKTYFWSLMAINKPNFNF